MGNDPREVAQPSLTLVSVSPLNLPTTRSDVFARLVRFIGVLYHRSSLWETHD